MFSTSNSLEKIPTIVNPQTVNCNETKELTMKIIKKCVHWIVFLIVSYIGIWLVLGISTLLPLLVGLWLFSLEDFWFFFTGSILLTFYYLLIFGGLGLFFTYLNKNKPDYWISNIYLILIAFFFFYHFIDILGRNISQDIKLFLNFKGIALFISLIPAYLQILFYSLIAPFINDDWI